MRIGYTHADVYDRESDYWQDIEDAENAQIKAQKNSSKGATNDEQKNCYEIKDILTQEG